MYDPSKRARARECCQSSYFREHPLREWLNKAIIIIIPCNVFINIFFNLMNIYFNSLRIKPNVEMQNRGILFLYTLEVNENYINDLQQVEVNKCIHVLTNNKTQIESHPPPICA